VETLRNGKDLVCTVVICKVWKLAMVLQLSVVASCVLKWSLDSISNPKPRTESLILRDSINIQWYLGIRPLWNKSNLVYVLFGRENFCLVYDLCLEYDSRARTCMSQNES
jgi:hypothetical protein